MGFFKKREKNHFGLYIDTWTYLGHSELSIQYNDGVIERTNSHCFVHNENGTRKFFLDGSADIVDSFKGHIFVMNILTPWALGEGELHKCVLNPSMYLHQKMKDDHNLYWSSNKKQWLSFDSLQDRDEEMILATYHYPSMFYKMY